MASNARRVKTHTHIALAGLGPSFSFELTNGDHVTYDFPIASLVSVRRKEEDRKGWEGG